MAAILHPILFQNKNFRYFLPAKVAIQHSIFNIRYFFQTKTSAKVASFVLYGAVLACLIHSCLPHNTLQQDHHHHPHHHHHNQDLQMLNLLASSMRAFEGMAHDQLKLHVLDPSWCPYFKMCTKRTHMSHIHVFPGKLQFAWLTH